MALPLLESSLTLLALTMPAQPLAEADWLPLFDAAGLATDASWRPVHDRVRGGASDGSISSTGDALRLEGRVSLEHDGGFASFRMDGELPDLSACTCIRLRVRGDGQVYKLGLRTGSEWGEVSWQASFAAPAGLATAPATAGSADSNRWNPVVIDFESLIPTWRGRLLLGAAVFDPAAIRQVEILIADEQLGPFALELASVHALRPTPGRGETEPALRRRAPMTRTDRIGAMLDAGADPSELLRVLHRTERVIVLSAPGDLDAATSIQLGALNTAGADLDERELRVVVLLGARAGRIAGRTVGPRHVRALREHWELPAGAWNAALVGKDGDVKQRWSRPADPTAIFALIDSMPMRRTEMRRRRSAAGDAD